APSALALLPYTTLFRSAEAPEVALPRHLRRRDGEARDAAVARDRAERRGDRPAPTGRHPHPHAARGHELRSPQQVRVRLDERARSEEHTSELQSRVDLV